MNYGVRFVVSWAHTQMPARYNIPCSICRFARLFCSDNHFAGVPCSWQGPFADDCLVWLPFKVLKRPLYFSPGVSWVHCLTSPIIRQVFISSYAQSEAHMLFACSRFSFGGESSSNSWRRCRYAPSEFLRSGTTSPLVGFWGWKGPIALRRTTLTFLF